VTVDEHPLPAATSRRELRERERAEAAAASASPVTVPVAPAATSARAAALAPAIDPAPQSRPQGAAAPAARSPRTRTARPRLGSQLLSFGALVAAGALVVGMSLPINVLGGYDLAAADVAELAPGVPVVGQEVDIAGTDASALGTERDGFEIKSWAQVLRDKYSRGNFAYSVYWTGPVRWPFPYEVPITDGFGPRPAPCGGCSTFHYAIDLVPGAGTPIYAIADGVVIDHVDGFGSWGNYVRIQHSIGGRTVITSYAHMQTGSSPLAIGDRIAVGDFVGLVGATGQVTAPHLHLEIEDDGVRVDPFIWLTQNTSR
jgi:murein DD-endopeptidase MepM/ murein hydrolase activator NlpD